MTKGADGIFAEDRIHHILLHAPRLTEFSWQDGLICRRAAHTWQPLTLPNTQLRKLDLQADLSAEEVVGLLRQCPILDSARVVLSIASGTVCPPPAHLLHHTLRCLEVSLCDVGTRLFKCLSLPALRKLTIADVSDNVLTWDHPAFLDLLQRSGCQLLSLALTVQLDVQETDMDLTLHLLQSLEHLKLQHCIPGILSNCVGDQLLRCLAVDEFVNGRRVKFFLELQTFILLDIFSPKVEAGLLPCNPDAATVTLL